MPDNIGALAMGAMQDLDDHGFPSRAWVILFGREDSTSIALKHLQPLIAEVDSGASVFIWLGGDNVSLDGILHSGVGVLGVLITTPALLPPG
jgi:hypothetical protein